MAAGGILLLMGNSVWDNYVSNLTIPGRLLFWGWIVKNTHKHVLVKI